MKKELNPTQLARAEFLANQGIEMSKVLSDELWRGVSVKPAEMTTISDVVQDLYAWYCEMENRDYDGPLSEDTDEFKALVDFAKADGYTVYNGRVFKIND